MHESIITVYKLGKSKPELSVKSTSLSNYIITSFEYDYIWFLQVRILFYSKITFLL